MIKGDKRADCMPCTKVKENPINEIDDLTDLYRIYHDDCYTSNYTVERERNFIGKDKYNPIRSNCEHFSE